MTTEETSQRSVQIIERAATLQGRIRVPGDKSITHRAILFGLLANGTTTVDNWLDAGDCQSSIHVAELLGAHVKFNGDQLVIHGTQGDLTEPTDVLDCGNSGTTTRMFLGALAARVPFACVTGDASLRRRPMARVIRPLSAMGASITARSQTYAPFAVEGQPLRGMEYVLPVASAQVKSAVLIAGLLADRGTTTVVEPIPTRDHTENMLTAFGAAIRRDKDERGLITTIEPGILAGTHVVVPGDISSASFILAAAAIVKDSTVTVEQVGLNPTRIGFLSVLRRMGVEVQISNFCTTAGEPMGDVTVHSTPLQPIHVTADEIPSLIDELPIISVLAAYANGTTLVEGAEELRVKETDRIRAVVDGLARIGVDVEERPDGFVVRGNGCVRGGEVESYHDHRIAMSFAIAGLASETPVSICDWECVAISYPIFLQTLRQISGKTLIE